MVDLSARPAVLEPLYQSAVALHAQAQRLQIGAVARLRRSLGSSWEESKTLESACDCVAIERGYDDWESMCRHVAEPPSEPQDAARWLVGHLLNGNDDRIDIDRLIKSDSAMDTVGARLAMLDSSVSVEQIITDGVNQPLAPLGVPALVYVCCSKYGAINETMRAKRRDFAEQLLSNDADPNVGMVERDSIRGFRTCLGGAIGCARDVELAKQLLDAGADINDGPTLYEGSAMWEAVRLRDHAALDVLVEAEPPEWHLCHALTHCLQLNDEYLALLLLDYDADPNWNKTVYGMGGNVLHEAIQCDAPRDTIEMLLQRGASIDATDNGGRTPIAVATALSPLDVIGLISTWSPDMDIPGPSEFERFVGICFEGDETGALDLKEKLGISGAKTYHDQLWLHEVIQRGSHKALDLLLTVDFDLNTIDYQGQTALHRAVMADDEHAVKTLLERGASTAIQNFDGDTVVELAIRQTVHGNTHIVDLLARSLSDEAFDTRGSRLRPQDVESFEQAADAIANGDVAQLKNLLEAKPYFNKARSVRPHRCALMNYIGVNGFEGERQKSPENAVEFIEVLLAHGCDPNVLCYTYRGGPGENTLGLLLSSGIVSSPAQQLAMTRALVKGGATISEGYQMLFNLLDAKDTDSVAEVVSSIDMNDSAVREAFFALGSNHEHALMEALIAAGFDVNSTNELEQTSLHYAALNGDESFVDWLLEHGADPTLRELQFDGNSAGWADAGGHAELAKRLGRLISRKS